MHKTIHHSVISFLPVTCCLAILAYVAGYTSAREEERPVFARSMIHPAFQRQRPCLQSTLMELEMLKTENDGRYNIIVRISLAS